MAGDDVRYVRAVTLDVDRIVVLDSRGIRPLLTDEIVALDDLGGRKEAIARRIARIGDRGSVRGLIGRIGAGATEVVVRVIDARIDHADRDPGTGDTLRLRDRRADVGYGLREVHAVLARRAYRHDVAVTRDRIQLLGVDAHDHGVVRDARTRDLATAERQQAREHRVLAARQGPAVRALLRLRQEATDGLRIAAVRDGERRAGELHDDIDFALGIRQGRIDLARPLHRRRERQ